MQIKDNFLRNVFTLITGSSLAQLFPILIMPILTRAYEASELGMLASYLAVVAMLSIFLTLRLDMAIILIHRENNATSLVKLCIKISLSLSVVLLLLIVGYQIIANHYQMTYEYWWALIPISAFLTACYALLLAWLNRKKDYKGMSTSRVVQSGSISLLQVLACLFPLGGIGLIFADILGRFFAVTLLLKRKVTINVFNLGKKTKRQLLLLRKYSDFPRYEMPASLLNVSAHQLPFVLMPLIFSNAATGMYFLVYRVMLLPSSFIGAAVSEVFRMQAVEELNKTGSCRLLFIKTAKSLMALSAIPFLVVAIFSPWLFSFLFGQQWYLAGEYARILAPLGFLELTSAPLSCILIVREKLKLDMVLQGAFLCLVCLSLFIGWYCGSLKILLILLSISGCCFYIAQIVASYHYSVQ